MFFGVLPLRAIAFQSLFLMIAIALEAVIFYQQLNLTYKESIRYSASVNLLSTVVGWLLFLPIQVFLPEEWRVQLISYVFFERFFPSSFSSNLVSVLTILCLGIFMAVFLLEFEGFKMLDILLEKAQPEQAEEAKKRMRLSSQTQRRIPIFKHTNQAYAVFVANACSFSAILFLLFIRWLENSA
jgi:hypothetical protein